VEVERRKWAANS